MLCWMTIIFWAFGLERDDVALLAAVARDVDAFAVDVDQAAWLTNCRACGRLEAHPARYTTLSSRCSSRRRGGSRPRWGPAAGGGRGLGVIRLAELTLENAVDVLRLLLLLHLGEVLAPGVAAPGAAVGTRREGPALHRPAALFVLEDVRAEAARNAHLRAGVASHRQPLRRFGWRHPLCGHRRDVFDRGDLDPRVLDRAHRGVATRAGALDLHLGAAQTVLDRRPRRLLSGLLGSVTGCSCGCP